MIILKSLRFRFSLGLYFFSSQIVDDALPDYRRILKLLDSAWFILLCFEYACLFYINFQYLCNRDKDRQDSHQEA